MKQLNVGVIGTGWCGGIRAAACSRSALVGELHLAETDTAKLAAMAEATSPTSTTDDWEAIIANDFTETTTVVDVAASDVGFHSEGCGTWTYLGP